MKTQPSNYEIVSPLSGSEANYAKRYVRDYSPEEQTLISEGFKPSAARYRRYWRVAYAALGIDLGGGLLTRLGISATLEEWRFGVFFASLLIFACVASLASVLNCPTRHASPVVPAFCMGTVLHPTRRQCVSPLGGVQMRL